MYWFTVPAIMKGWIDRVLTLGFAYSQEKRYSQGIFKVRQMKRLALLGSCLLPPCAPPPLICWLSAQNKKAMLSFTTGSQESMFSANGINGDMNVTLWPLQVLLDKGLLTVANNISCDYINTSVNFSFQNGILHYCGFQVLAPQIFWAPSHISSEARSTMLEGWRTRLQGLLGEEPLSFTPLDCFDGERGFQLKPEVHEKHATKEFGLTVGIHLGKPLPPNNQMKAGV